jgi:hypothetical protein
MASAGSASALNNYDTYVNDAPANSNQPELSQIGQHEVDYSSAYLNNLLHPTLTPHGGILPNTSSSYVQHTHTDLSILDSETHNDSRVIEEIRSSSGTGVCSNDTTFGSLVLTQDAVDSEVASSVQSDGRSREKSRTNRQRRDDKSVSKKARGRPRVDATDETAADVSLN